MRTRLKIGIAALGVLLVLAGAGLWWFLRDDAPAAANLQTATASVDSPASSFDGNVTGSWTVDTATGTFDYESATGSFAGFRIEEELASIGSTTAVGRTGDVAGTVEISGTTVTAATFEVDVSTITTNESRRDDNVQSALETNRYPTATFNLTEPITLPTDATNGEPISVTAVGDLTIHGVTRQVAFPLEAQLTGDTLVIVGSLDVTFSDFDVEVPQSQIVLSVEDHGVLELQLLLTRP